MIDISTPAAKPPPAALTATAPTTTADTFGWDTVFALPTAVVNAAIVAAHTSPTSFSQLIEAGCTVEGTFSDWQICPGGDGRLLHLALPITSGQLNYNGVTAFANVTATIEVELDFFDSTATPPAGATGTFHDLKVKTTPSPGNNAVVTVLGVEFADSNTDFMVQSLLPGSLTTWLNANLQLFDHIFATVNLNRIADTGSFQWLYPTATDYAYADNTTAADSVLAVLCMTNNRPCTGLVPELTPAAIPPGAGGGFLINQSRFLEEMVLPTMPSAFPGVQPSDFALSADGTTLNLVTSNLNISSTDSNGKHYTTNVTSLSIAVAGTTVQMNSVCVTEISPGIYSHSSTVHTYSIGLTTTGGAQSLGFQEVGTPVVTKWTTKSEGIEILQWMEVAIGVIATVVLGVLTAGAGFVVGAIVIGALVGVATQIPNMVALVNTDKAPDLSLLVFNTTDPIRWTDSQNFLLSSAALNGSLQLGGTFSPA